MKMRTLNYVFETEHLQILSTLTIFYQRLPEILNSLRSRQLNFENNFVGRGTHFEEMI